MELKLSLDRHMVYMLLGSIRRNGPVPLLLEIQFETTISLYRSSHFYDNEVKQYGPQNIYLLDSFLSSLSLKHRTSWYIALERSNL
jgi:hypothetical protein